MQRAGINEKSHSNDQSQYDEDLNRKQEKYINSINITEEARRLGKLPIEFVAINIA